MLLLDPLVVDVVPMGPGDPVMSDVKLVKNEPEDDCPDGNEFSVELLNGTFDRLFSDAIVRDNIDVCELPIESIDADGKFDDSSGK